VPRADALIVADASAAREVVGRAGFGRPLVSQPMRKRMGTDRRPADLFVVGVDEIKNLEAGRLRRHDHGPGSCHFPMTDEFGQEYFDQLTAEELHTTFHMGVAQRVWRPKRRRNEALDCSVLDYAALVLLNPNFDALAKRLDAGQGDGGPAGPRQSKPGRIRGGFVRRY
jgi:phage terminase large subunit GpA-like protein